MGLVNFHIASLCACLFLVVVGYFVQAIRCVQGKMRFSLVRCKMPTNTKLWQDPVLGYFETHGKMKFIVGEDYGISNDEKKAVLWRYRLKEILKKEYLRREYDPHTFKYKEGVVIDPAVFRWYSANAMQYEFFRYTPRSVFLYAGSFIFVFYILIRIMFQYEDHSRDMCLDGELLWWDRMYNRHVNTCGNYHFSPTFVN